MNKNIRVLSYNIFWKAYNNALKQCKNDNCKNNTDYNIKCEHDREPLDFIAVQEATNFKLGPGIKEHYYYIRVRQRKETMITYFSKKYDLIKYYYGNLAHNDDRPYMLLIFENMWFINIHMPHNIHIVDELALLEEKIKSHGLIHANERIIVAGDFNYNFFNDTNLYLFGIPIYYTQINKILERNYDAVLDTDGPPISLKVVENIKKYASDHLPVVAVLL
jgi:endonuclease/exonuclease/phosphatase family metal-dependent hydrolase